MEPHLFETVTRRCTGNSQRDTKDMYLRSLGAARCFSVDLRVMFLIVQRELILNPRALAEFLVRHLLVMLFADEGQDLREFLAGDVAGKSGDELCVGCEKQGGRVTRHAE